MFYLFIYLFLMLQNIELSKAYYLVVCFYSFICVQHWWCSIYKYFYRLKIFCFALDNYLFYFSFLKLQPLLMGYNSWFKSLGTRTILLYYEFKDKQKMNIVIILLPVPLTSKASSTLQTWPTGLICLYLSFVFFFAIFLW